LDHVVKIENGSFGTTRFGYDHYGGYDRGGRGGYADDRSYGIFGNRSAAGYQNGISGMLVDANYLGFSFFFVFTFHT
jgi:hypothetical protein